MAEDFAPFNLDVTTVEPPVLAEGVPIDQANGVAATRGDRRFMGRLVSHFGRRTLVM